MDTIGIGQFTRRRVVGLVGGLLAAGVAGAARANENDEPVGVVGDAEGAAFARRHRTRRLEVRSSILLGDLVWTAARSRAALDLDGGTRINLGPKARLRIDRFVAAAGGTLELGEGALVFDRADDLPKLDIEVRTTFGLIGVRGTRFFAGPSRGGFGVFVARGSVRVYAGGAERVLEAGDGVDIPARFARPSSVRKWGAARIDEAFASVLG